MKPLLAFLKSAAEESPGVTSSQRLVFLGVTATNIVAFLVTLGFILAGSPDRVPDGVLPFATLLQGIATAGKVMQARTE